MRELEMIIRYERIGDSDMHNYRKVGELVRCKDCKHLMTYNDGIYDCKYLAERMFAEGELNNKPNDFCCWGERKDETVETYTINASRDR